jgi:hypothetical protein
MVRHAPELVAGMDWVLIRFVDGILSLVLLVAR